MSYVFVFLVGWFLNLLVNYKVISRTGPKDRASDNFTSWETLTSVSDGHIILTPTQPVGSGRPQRESNPGPPHQESRALPTELPQPPSYVSKNTTPQDVREGYIFALPISLFQNMYLNQIRVKYSR